MVCPRTTKVDMVRDAFMRVLHAVAYCTNASRGLSSTTELLVCDRPSFFNAVYRIASWFLLQMERFTKHWSGMVQPSKTISVWDTGVPPETLKFVGAKSCSVPPGFVGSFHAFYTDCFLWLYRCGFVTSQCIFNVD